MKPVKGVLMPRLPLPRSKFLLTQINSLRGNFGQGNTMTGAFNILSPWKVILLFPLLFFFAVGQSYAQDRTLQWDANTDPDPAGYKVYYGIESRHPDNPNAYSGTGALQGDSPIDITLAQDENLDPNIVEFTLTGLDDNKVYFCCYCL